MTEEEFIYGPKNVREYVNAIEDIDEKKEIGWEISRRISFIKLLSPEVKQIFLDNYEPKGVSADSFFKSNGYPSFLQYDTKKKKYYVYEDYTCDDNKVCYVGYSCDLDFTYTSTRDKRVVMLIEKKGLAKRKLIDDLTEFQSVVYSSSYKKECTKRGEVLLNYDLDRSTNNLHDEIVQSNGRSFIYKDLFLKHYFEKEYFQKNEFDEVTYDSLKCTYFLQNQKREIVEWLREKNARIMRTVSKTVNSVIVSPYITYYDYVKYHIQNIRVLSENDVLDYINNNTYLPHFNNKKRKPPKAQKKKSEKQEYIRQYLVENAVVIDEYFQYMRRNNFPIRDLQEPLSTSFFQGVIPDETHYSDIQYILMWKASGLQNGNMSRLIDIYLKLGLFEEAMPLLATEDNRAADYYYYKDIIEQE